jgi:hypothetical protein
MKRLLGLVALFAVLFSVASVVSAAEVNNDELNTAVNESLKEEHYDYKDGSLEIKDAEVFTVEDPEGKISEVWAGVAEYDTVRDNIFYFSHTDVVFYDINGEKMLTATQAGNFDSLLQFKEQYKDETGKTMHLTAILLLLALILVVPAFYMFVWDKQIYSTTRFTDKGNLYYREHTFN